MEPPHPLIHKTMDRMRKKNGGKDPVQLLVTTNHPEHYSEEEEIATSPQLLSMFTNVSETPDTRTSCSKPCRQSILRQTCTGASRSTSKSRGVLTAALCFPDHLQWIFVIS
jgi:hypothetical protein